MPFQIVKKKIFDFYPDYVTYPIAGSFAKFILREYGIETVKKLAQKISLSQIKKFEREWLNYLKRLRINWRKLISLSRIERKCRNYRISNLRL
ncbi:MAG: hypothetical protein AB1393_09650 [Candidatus Edwardsbacteria bacterium]